TARVTRFTAAGAATLTGGVTTISFNGGGSTLGSLMMSGTSKIDIQNNSLAVSFGSPGADPVASIAAYLASGYAGGLWTGASGIVSSTAAAGTPGQTLSIGYADGNTDFNTAAGANQVLVKYTLAGDTNLDGLVNFNDLVNVVQNFNKAGTDWAHGDFRY